MDYFDGLKTAIRTVKDHVDARMPSFAWGEVTQVSPVVLVVPDNAAAALEASTLAPLQVGDRVWFVRYSGRVVIVGVAKGVPVPAPATQAEVDEGIDTTAYVSPATLKSRAPDTGTFTPAAGWSIYAGHGASLTRDSKRAYLNVTLIVVSGDALNANLGSVPTGFRPTELVAAGALHNSNALSGAVFVDETGKVSVPYWSGAGGVGIYWPLAVSWPL